MPPPPPPVAITQVVLKKKFQGWQVWVHFNLQYYSNVVPTDSHVYFTALVDFFSLGKFGMYCKCYISKIIQLKSNQIKSHACESESNQIVKFVSKPNPSVCGVLCVCINQKYN